MDSVTWHLSSEGHPGDLKYLRKDETKFALLIRIYVIKFCTAREGKASYISLDWSVRSASRSSHFTSAWRSVGTHWLEATQEKGYNSIAKNRNPVTLSVVSLLTELSRCASNFYMRKIKIALWIYIFWNLAVNSLMSLWYVFESCNSSCWMVTN
jgi:hypothetical protein